MTQPESPLRSPHRRGVLERREHTAFDGTPYYDAELDVPQSKAHRMMVVALSSIWDVIAEDAGLVHLSDEPIWYLHPETDEQRHYYGDLVLSRPVDSKRILATDLLLVAEVVTTTERRKALKDTRFQRLLNEYNHVPEFLLFFPEMNDGRALTYCRLRGDEYEEQACVPGATVESEAVPGLAFRVMPREQWRLGAKVTVLFRGEPRLPLADERARAAAAEERAQTAEERAQTAEERAQTAEERAQTAEERAQTAARANEKLRAQLRAAGLDPDAE